MFLQAFFQPHPELLMESLCFFALHRRFLWSHADALSGRVFVVPLERVFAREEITTMLAKGDFEWVRLHGITVALEIFPRFQFSVGTEPAFDLPDRPTCPVGFRGNEECLLLLLENFWKFELSVLRFLLPLLLHRVVVLRFLFHTPLHVPNHLSIRGVHRIPMVEA